MNLIRGRTTTVALVALTAVGALSACKKNDQYAASDTTALRSDSAAGSTAADTSTMTPPATTPAPVPATSTWSDASILGFALAANSGEVALGKLGETKATNRAVKAYARMIVTDHRAMLNDVKSLTTKLSVMADTTSGGAKDLVSHGSDEINDLTTKPASADWDKNYMDKMIDDHQKVLDKLQDASKNTTNTDVRAALEKATGKVQQHLTKAKDIKANQLKA